MATVGSLTGSHYDLCAVNFISVGTEQWMRTSTPRTTWQPASAATLTDGLFSVFLPEVVLQSTYVGGPAGLAHVSTDRITNLGSTVAGGSPASHLRLRWKHGQWHYALQVYVD